MVFIQTVGETKNLQQQNKLKGMALEFIVSKAIDDPKNQDNIEQIKKEATEQLARIYKVKKSFILEKNGEQTVYLSRNDNFLDPQFVFNLDTLTQGTYTLKKEINSADLYTGYKTCSNCGNRLPKYVCKTCEGALTPDADKLVKYKAQLKKQDAPQQGEQDLLKSMWWCTCSNTSKYRNSKKILETSKCRKCNDGYFHKTKTHAYKEFSKAKTNLSKKEVFQKLQKDNHICKYSLLNQVNRKTTDIWTDENQLMIYEAKNNEDTKVNTSSVIQVVTYMKSLQKSGLSFSKSKIIYNGLLPDKTVEIADKMSDSFEIEFIPIKQFLKQNNLIIDKIEIGKQVEGEQYGDTGSYNINTHVCETLPDTIELEIR